MNTVTPRVFIAATRQNDGKTTTSLGLLSALMNYFPRVGFIKPVGQRFVEIDAQRVDEDSVLMDRVYQLNCPLGDMSPIAVVPDFTKRYLEASNYDTLVTRLQRALDRVAWEKDFVLCEGSGHAGVGAVFDLSNARVAKLLKAKVILVTRGGIGRPIDEISLNQALFEKEGIEVIGVILNKVLPGKMESIREFAERGLRKRGLKLLGVIPHEPILSSPTLELIRDELKAEVIGTQGSMQNIARQIIIGAMSAAHATRYFTAGTLLITPGDRHDLLEAAAGHVQADAKRNLAGIILTNDGPTCQRTLDLAQRLPYPILRAKEASYEVASLVHDATVKTRPGDTGKISLIRDLVSKHVDVAAIVKAL